MNFLRHSDNHIPNGFCDFLEPDFLHNEALSPYQPLAMKVALFSNFFTFAYCNLDIVMKRAALVYYVYCKNAVNFVVT